MVAYRILREPQTVGTAAIWGPCHLNDGVPCTAVIGSSSCVTCNVAWATDGVQRVLPPWYDGMTTYMFSYKRSNHGEKEHKKKVKLQVPRSGSMNQAILIGWHSHLQVLELSNQSLRTVERRKQIYKSCAEVQRFSTLRHAGVITHRFRNQRADEGERWHRESSEATGPQSKLRNLTALVRRYHQVWILRHEQLRRSFCAFCRISLLWHASNLGLRYQNIQTYHRGSAQIQMQELWLSIYCRHEWVIRY
jgi:hypothetical protein